MKCKDCGGEMSPNEINSAGRHLVWATCFDVVQERERAALARAEAAITESNSAARRAFSAEVENQRLTKEAAGLRARIEAAEAEAIKQARLAVQARMRHANLLRRRGLEEPLTTVENEAEAAGLRARIEAAEAERDDANIAASLNKSRVEEMVDRLSFEMKQREALAARVAELEAQLAAAGSRVIELEAAQDESYHAYLELKEEADSRGEPLREACRQNMILTARVALAEERTRAAVATSLASAAAVAYIGGLLGVDPSLPVEEFRETVIARVVELTASSAWRPVTEDEPEEAAEVELLAVGYRDGGNWYYHDDNPVRGWRPLPPAPDMEPTP